jgi:hypothetical protein
MKILFLDDCFRRDKNYFGHGGFSIDEVDINGLCEDLSRLKRRFGIPYHIEFKWSPPRDHFLRTTFRGDRQQLYKEVIGLLQKYNVSIISVVHDLNDCYGIRNYNWDINRACLWATKQQFKYIAERFEKPLLLSKNDFGIIIADKYSEHRSEVSILKDVFDVVTFGSEYRKFSRICMNPLMAISNFCPPIQCSDIVIGAIVSALSDSRYAQNIFDNMGLLFLRDPHEGSISFDSTISCSVLGYGLVLFPQSLKAKGLQLFRRIDDKYVYDKEGVRERNA